MCIVNRIKENQKGLFFPRETHDPIDALGESKRHLRRKARMVKWRKLSQGNFAVSKAFACAPELRVTATKYLVKVLWRKGSFWLMDLRFCPWLFSPHALGQKNTKATGAHGWGYQFTSQRTSRREAGRP